MDEVSRTLTYAYDADGNRTRITHPDNVSFWTCYDGLDRADRSWWGGTVTCPGTASGSTQFVDIDFNAAGARATINRASSYTDYIYEPSQRLSHLTQRFAGNVGNVTHDFGYNSANQITSLTTGSNDFVWTRSYNVNRGYLVNGLNQYTMAGSATFTYDPNANLTSDGSTSFVYDVENRLVSASGLKNATLRYDPMGRLYEINGASGVTRFLYDGDHVVAEYASGGQMLRRYFWGPDADEPILWDEGSAMDCSSTKFLHQNHQGSVIAVANCLGNRIAVNTYDEYGIPASTNQGRFQYTGQAWLPDLGMSYYKARMYSPTLGRFMQTDPIGYEDQINLYAYVANDPMNKTDPSGKELTPEECRSGANGCKNPVERVGEERKPTRSQNSQASKSRGSRENKETSPQNGPCPEPDSLLSSARAVLETTATGADIATVGLAAGGITGPAAVATKVFGYGLEASLGVVNAYDAYANGNWAPLAEQGASLGTRLIPGGRALQGALKTARGPVGLLRNSAGRFRSSYLNNPAVEELGNIAMQKSVGGAVGAAICPK